MERLGIVFLALWTVIASVTGVQAYANQDLKGNQTENSVSRSLLFSLHTLSHRFAASEKINIMARIVNRGFEPMTIYIHRNYIRNFTLLLKGADGKIIPPKSKIYDTAVAPGDSFHREFTGTNFHSRAIVLQPGEVFERKILLNNYFNFSENLLPGKKLTTFSLNAMFYPNPEQAPEYFSVSSNEVSLLIDSGRSTGDSRGPLVSAEPLRMSPEETVFLALSAEFEGRWDSFFKYVRLQDFILAYPRFGRDYANAAENEKNIVLKKFQDYLMRRNRLKKFDILENLSVKGKWIRPMELIENDRQKGVASVKVKAVRVMEGFTREFLYTYYLNANGPFWQITGVETSVLR